MTIRFTLGVLRQYLLERLQHQFHAGGERDELVWAGADRRLLEPVLAHLLHVFFRHDPGGTGGTRIEGEEIRPWLLQFEADVLRIRRLHRVHALLHQTMPGAAIALERKFHIVGGDRLAIVEQRALAQHEVVAEPVLGRGPGFRETRRRVLPGHRLHHGIVQRVHQHERRDDARRLCRIEPCRRQRDVHADVQLPRRARSLGRPARRGGHPERCERQKVPARCNQPIAAGPGCPVASHLTSSATAMNSSR